MYILGEFIGLGILLSWLFIAVVAGILGALLADRKNRSLTGWFILCLLIPVCVLFAMAIKPLEGWEYEPWVCPSCGRTYKPWNNICEVCKIPRPPGSVECPYCREKIKASATRCPHCTSHLEPAAIQEDTQGESAAGIPVENSAPNA